MNYIRDASAVKATLIRSNKAVVTTTGCTIIFPERFVKRGLATLSDKNYISGGYALVLPDGKYSVCNVNAMMQVLPSRIEKTKFPDGKYYKLTFQPNSVLLVDTTLVKDAGVIEKIFDEYVFKGNVPWYVEYNDLGMLFDTSAKHAGSAVNKNLAIIELLASMLARDPRDPKIPYRLVADEIKSPPSFISLMNVYYAAATTLNKLVGGNFDKGVVGALVQTTTEVSRIEKALRA
jgi:hypothetical protein